MRLAAALLLVLAAPAARAHQAGLSYGEITVAGDRLDLVLRASSAELATLGAGGDPLGDYEVAQDGVRCDATRGAVSGEPPDGVRLTAAYTCPRGIERVTVTAGLVERLPRGHTHLVDVRVADRGDALVARAGAATFVVEGAPHAFIHAARYAALGVAHIFGGPDHVAFVLGLLLLGGTLRRVAAAVTGFTTAHSITLAVAALGLFTPPARLVEPLIAASVLFVGVENLRALRPGSRRSGARWTVAFAFGLVHGFGFASVLRELGLPSRRLATALLSFNAGVELGQLAILAVAFPALALLRRRPALAIVGARAASLAIGVAGAVWLVERVLAA